VGQNVKACHRLKANYEFRRVFQRGKSFATPRLVLYCYRDSRLSSYHVGFSVSKKVGNAVVRNRLKRVLRECFLCFEPVLVGNPSDLVVVCRVGCKDSTFVELYNDVEKLLKRAKFVI